MYFMAKLVSAYYQTVVPAEVAIPFWRDLDKLR